MAAVISVEDRIVSRFMEKLEKDKSIPEEVIRRLRLLRAAGGLKDPQAILRAIREGVQAHAENSTA